VLEHSACLALSTLIFARVAVTAPDAYLTRAAFVSALAATVAERWVGGNGRLADAAQNDSNHDYGHPADANSPPFH
jgi:hypothetical protein